MLRTTNNSIPTYDDATHQENIMKSLITITLSLALFACSAEQESASTAQQTPPAATTTAQSTPPSDSPQVAAHEQTIDVSGEFSPASVTIPANTPARLHFRRGDKPSCADEIIFPELNMRKTLAENQTVTFDVPAQQARTVTFVCGMNMMKGTIVVQ